MSQKDKDIYTIPPNFAESGTVGGGMFKARNAAEALVIAIGIGLPVFQFNFGLTAKIIILCLTALPLALVALIGVSGEPLSSFILSFFRFLQKRRHIGTTAQTSAPKRRLRDKSSLSKKAIPPKPKAEEFASEFAEEKKQKSFKQRKSKKAKPDTPPKTRKQPEINFLNPTAEFIPIEKIENGIVTTKDRRYLKIIEIAPVNFLLRSEQEQRNIIYSFISYLKISPVKMQIKVLTRKANVNKHIENMSREMEQETDEQCRVLQEDYIQLVRKLGSREAVTRRFFICFEYEPFNVRAAGESDAIAALNTVATTAQNYFRQCGNSVIVHENEDAFQAEVYYEIFNRHDCIKKPLSKRISEVQAQYKKEGRPAEQIPVAEFIAPDSIDFTKAQYVLINGLYHAYLLIPSGGYKTQVMAGWTSLIVNAGEGIDVDFFFFRQPKEQIIRRLGQRLRINRSKIKEASDTNTDFDDLEGSIQSGYFLKNGMAQNQDFYYISTLLTVTAETEEELEWRISEMKRLMISQDLEVMRCTFREEEALLSALPLVSLSKALFQKSKRNALTAGVASCYPFVSYEVSDDNGILLGVNKHNRSLVITDIFNSRIYKNANICIAGCTGAGKTFLLQTIALRLRRRHVHTYIIAPIKGHEFRRACQNIGGAFISVSPASSTCINVMEIRKLDHATAEILDGPQENRSELAAKIQQLHIFMSLLIPDMTYEERQLLDEAMVQTYHAKGITHDNNSLIDPLHPDQYKTMPVLGDLYQILMESKETKRLGNILNRLVNGSARSFSQQTNVPLDNEYTVLDLSDLTGDLLPVGMFVVLDFLWDKVKEDRTVQKAVICDELWALIGASSNRQAADFVLTIAKTIRAFSGSGIFATQDMNDFFALDGGKYGKGIINACQTKIILNLEYEEAQRVQQLLRLSDSELMAVTRFERGSGLIISNNNNIMVDFKASELEKELITTDRIELQEIISRNRGGMV